MAATNVSALPIKNQKINKYDHNESGDGIKMADCVIVAPDVYNGVFALG